MIQLAENTLGASHSAEGTIKLWSSRALFADTNDLRGSLVTSGIYMQVFTLNLHFVATRFTDGTSPAFTEPVDASGNSPCNPLLQPMLDGLRQTIGCRQPRIIVADAFVQLAEMAEPLPNVIAAAPRGLLVVAGGNEMV